MHRDSQALAQSLKRHAVKHNLFIALERGPGNDHKVTANAVACADDVTPGQQTRNRHIAAEVFVLYRSDMKAHAKAFIQLFHLRFQDRSEERSRHDGAADLALVLRRVSFQSPEECAEFIAERAHHAYAVFDLGIVAVMFSSRHRAAGAKINLIAQESEGSAQPTV